MPRPGPLQDLPLDLFNHNLPSKRPRSPGPPSLYSPTKRRILNEEGFVDIVKSPISRARLARFTHALPASASPARKLDFGSPKGAPSGSNSPVRADVAMRHSTPTRRSSRSLAPSPELKPRSRSTPFTPSPAHDISLPSPTLSTHVPTLIPREVPPSPDPQSIHFPGFFVFQDTHVVFLPPAFNGEPTTEPNPDVVKENVPPRRKTRKAATASASPNPKAQLFSPELNKRELWGTGKAKTIPGTPKRIFDIGDMDITPTRRLGVEDSPRMTRATARKLKDGEGKEMR